MIASLGASKYAMSCRVLILGKQFAKSWISLKYKKILEFFFAERLGIYLMRTS